MAKATVPSEVVRLINQLFPDGTEDLKSLPWTFAARLSAIAKIVRLVPDELTQLDQR
jgi:hypothetical protein